MQILLFDHFHQVQLLMDHVCMNMREPWPLSLRTSSSTVVTIVHYYFLPTNRIWLYLLFIVYCSHSQTTAEQRLYIMISKCLLTTCNMFGKSPSAVGIGRGDSKWIAGKMPRWIFPRRTPWPNSWRGNGSMVIGIEGMTLATAKIEGASASATMK